MAAGKSGSKFFKTMYRGEIDFDSERFLTEVNARFASQEVRHEVQWRLDAIDNIAARGELADVVEGLRNQLSRVFSTLGDEAEILRELRKITEITREDGEVIDLRRFRTRRRRTLPPEEYRALLQRKIDNTHFQIKSLTMYYPEALDILDELRVKTEGLRRILDDSRTAPTDLKAAEDRIRRENAFQRYEALKLRFLREWLARFANVSEAEAARMSPEDIQKLIVETQRHQLTQLVKGEVVLSDLDMTQYLGVHDTLEGTFRNAVFWERANQGAKNGFKHWVLGVVQAFGMVQGKRHVLFQRKDLREQMVLFGLGFAPVPVAMGGEGPPADGTDEADAEMAGGTPRLLVPYVKPFTRKTGYLFEVRQRNMSDPEEYHQQLRHALMPFLFAFDAMKEFKVSSELISFFTSTY